MFLKFFSKKNKAGDRSQQTEHQLIDGVDPDLNYCPSCGDEYRADIASCVTCNITLISGREKLVRMEQTRQELSQRSMDISMEDDLISIRKGSLNDMKYLRKLLISERVPALLAGDESSCGKGCCGPEMYLQIKREDLPAASEVLTRDFIKSTALDSHDLTNAQAVFDHQAKETVCPACGCRFSPSVGACPECGLCFE